MSYDVTIGIPFYCSVDTIEQTLESALSQTYESIEFLLIDDGGNDGSLAKVQDMIQYHPRGKDVRIISHEHNIGVASSRNEIIDKAQGEFVYFLDSDDVIDENAISLLMKHARVQDAEVVFGSYEKIDLDGRKTIYRYPYKVFTESNQLAAFAYRKYGGIQASACNYIVKTSLLRTNKHYFLNSNYWEDLVFTFDLVTYISRALLLPDITYHYYRHSGSLSHYQVRSAYEKEEIMKNVSVIQLLKDKCATLCGKDYLPYLCYNLEMNSFYIVCYILKNYLRIAPKFLDSEMRMILSYPLSIWKIIRFRHRIFLNLIYCALSHLPLQLSLFVVKFLGKMKKVI